MKKVKYTEEFKKQVLDHANQAGVTKAANDLGVSESNIYNWRSDIKKINNPVSLATSLSDIEELKRLRRENSELKKINHILKSAAAFFSQDHLK